MAAVGERVQSPVKECNLPVMLKKILTVIMAWCSCMYPC